MLPASGGSTSYDTGGEIAAIPVSTQPFYGDVDPVNGDIYVADDGSASVNVISGSTNALVDTISVGSDPVDVAYDSVNGDLYETNFASDTVSIILGGTNTVSSSLSVGTNPWGVAVDTTNGNVYVAERGANAVVEISEATNTVANTISVGSDPEGVAYDSGNGEIYVTNEGTDTVSVISTFSNSVVSTITVGNEPYWVAFDGQNGNLYVANFNSATLSVVSGTTNSVTATITMIEEPDSVAYDSGNGDLYVDDGFGPVEAVSTATDTVVATFPQASYAQGTIYDSANGDVYVSVTDSDTELVISTMLAVQPLTTDLRGIPAVGSVTASVDLGGSTSPQYLAFDPVNGNVYVADADANDVSVISAASNVVVATIPVESDPFGVVYDSGNGDVYVANLDSNTVSVLSGATNDVIGTISVGSQPYGLAYDSGSGDVYVTNNAADTVSVISGATNEVIATTTVGADPLEAAYDSGNGNVYVTNIGTDTVSVISGASNTVIDTITVGEEPFGVAYDSANGDLYVAIASETQVTVISGASETTVATISIGANPYDVVYDSANGFVYATTYGSQTAIAISGASDQWVGTVSIPYTPYGLAYDGESGTVYVTNPGFGILTGISTLSSTVSSSPVSMDVGQSLLLSSPLLGQGAGGDVPMVSTSPSTGITCAINPLGYTIVSGACLPSSAGEYTVTFTVEDELGSTVSTSVIVTVDAEPSVSTPSISSASVDVGQTASFSVSVTGGSGSYVYSWAGLPPGCAGVNSPTLSCTPSSNVASPFTVSVSVTDSNDFFASSATTPFTVYSDPSAGSILSSLPSADVGQSVGFGISVSGGTGVYSYVWEQLPGCNTADSSTLSCTPTTTGTSYTYVQVTDSDGYTIDSSGIYFTVSAAPTIQAITATTAALDVGQSVTLSTAATPGSGSPVFSWSGLPTGCLSASALSVACSPTAAGTYQVSAHVVDSNGMNVSSSSFTLTVSPALGSPSVSSSRATLDVGQPVVLTATVSGGTGSYTYSWSGLPTGCASSDAASVACTPTGAGTFSTVSVVVTDGNGASHGSGSMTLTVSVDPTIQAITASRGSLDVGQALTLSSTATTGSGAPSYAWTGLPAGCASANALTISCNPSATGTFSITISITDSNGVTVDSTELLLTVSPLPTITSLAASTIVVDVGQPIVFVASGTSGSGGLLFDWTGLPTGCAGSASWTISCSPSAPGSFTSVNLAVFDSNGGTTSAYLGQTIRVWADPVIQAITASRGTLDVSQALTLSTSSSLGSGNDVYSWTGLPTGCVSSNSATISCNPSAAGSFAVVASVVDGDGMSVSTAATTIVVSALPTVTGLSASTSSLDVGQSVVLTAAGTSGSGSLQFSWGGLPSGCSSAASWTLSCTPTGAGTSPSIDLTVTDSNGGSATGSTPLSIAVFADPTISTPTATRSTLDVGQTTVLTSSSSAPAGSPTYAWSGLPGWCTGIATLTVTCKPLAGDAGTFSTSVTVTDVNGVSATSGSYTFTVSNLPTVTALSGSASSLDVGQGLTFTAAGTVGSGGDTLTWSGLPLGCNAVDAWSFGCTPNAPGTSSTTLVVTDSNGGTASWSSGFVTTVYADPTVTTPTAAPAALDVGQKTTITALASAPAGGPTYLWTGLPSGCTGTSTLTVTCTPTAGQVGSYAITVSVTDSNGETVASGVLSLVVSALPTITALSASRSALDVGQTLTVTATGTVGSGGLQFTWGGLPAGCAGANAWTFSCSPTASGSFPVVLSVSDSNGGGASWSSPVTIAVSADPSASAPTASSAQVDVGQSVVLTAHATPGSGSDTFSWWGLPTGCLSANAISITCTPSVAGSFSFGYSVLDSNGVNATSGVGVLSVSARLGVPSVVGSAAALDVGTSVTLTATASGGTLPYTYLWTGLPAGCAGQDAATILCVPSVAGASSVTVTVTDAAGVSQTSSALSLTVSSAPSVGAPSASRASLDVGQTTSLTVLETTGTTTSTIVWAGLPAGCTSSSDSTISCTPTSAGIYTVWVTVTDANGVSAESSPFTLSVAEALTGATLGGSSSVLDAGEPLTLAASATGGSGGYTYAWSGLPTGCVGANEASLTCVPSTSGTFTPTVSITDSNGASVTATGSITVSPTLSVSLAASPTSAVSGTTLTFTASATGGTGTLTYAWYLNGSLVAGTTGTTLTLSDAKGGSYVVWVGVSDTTGTKTASSAVTVQVASPPSTSTTTTPSSSSTVTAQVSPMEEDALIGMLVLLAVIAVLLVALLITRPKPPAPSGGPRPAPEPAPATSSRATGTGDGAAAAAKSDEDFRED